MSVGVHKHNRIYKFLTINETFFKYGKILAFHKVFVRICRYEEIQAGRRFRLRDRIQLSQHPLKVTCISCRADYHLLCISS